MAKGRERLPYLRWFTDDYFADTFNLEFHEHGIYLAMLALAWSRPDCDLPNDMNWLFRALSQMAKTSHKRVHATAPKLLKTYWQFDPQGCGGIGRWTNRRLLQERDNVEIRSRQARDSAKQRWHGTEENQRLTVYERNAKAMLPIPIQDKSTDRPVPTAEVIHNNGVKNGFDQGSPPEPSQPPRPNGNANQDTSATTMSPDMKLARFQLWLSSVVPGSWRTIQAAFDANDPDHRVALQACKTAAATHRKGWPFNAPQ